MGKLTHTQELESYMNIFPNLWGGGYEYQISCVNSPTNNSQINPFESSMRNKAHCWYCGALGK